MKDSRKDPRSVRASAKSKLDQMLAKIDAAEYTELLVELRAEYKPSGPFEEDLVKRLAIVSCRLRACFPVETQILREGMEACRVEGDTPDKTLARAYLRDIEGPDLLSKLSRYESRLQNNFSQCLRMLEQCRAARRRTANAADIRLAKLEPCTSVVQ